MHLYTIIQLTPGASLSVADTLTLIREPEEVSSLSEALYVGVSNIGLSSLLSVTDIVTVTVAERGV